MTDELVSLVPEVVNLALYAGDGVGLRLTVKKGDGTPWNLTGTVQAQIRQDRMDTQVEESFAVDLSQGATGVVVLSLTGAQTTALGGAGPFAGYWDVQWTATGAEPATVVQGAVTCIPDVTR
jgi:hypothetical protein